VGKRDSLVLPHVKGFCTDEQANIISSYTEKDLVATVVKGLIVISIDLPSNRGKHNVGVFKNDDPGFNSSKSLNDSKFPSAFSPAFKNYRTWVDMMLLVCTAILYSDDPTVLVRTVPEFLLVIATTLF
jgi:hypothetical protein